MVDRQINAVAVGLCVRGEESEIGNIDGEHRFRRKRLPGLETLDKPAVFRRDFGILKETGGLAERAQREAQRRRAAAERVAVRTAMGDNEEIVALF